MIIRLVPTIRALVGRGVSFRVEHPYKLIINASAGALDGVDLTILKRNRNLLINSLPVGLAVSAGQLLRAMDHYQLKVTELRATGATDYYQAELRAMPLMRDYIRSHAS